MRESRRLFKDSPSTAFILWDTMLCNFLLSHADTRAHTCETSVRHHVVPLFTVTHHVPPLFLCSQLGFRKQGLPVIPLVCKNAWNLLVWVDMKEPAYLLARGKTQKFLKYLWEIDAETPGLFGLLSFVLPLWVWCFQECSRITYDVDMMFVK